MSGKGQSASKGTPGGSAGSSSSNNSSSSSYSVDAKLTFIVRQYAGEQRDKRQAATEQGAVDYLFGKHQEAISTRGLQKQYKRKPQAQLRRSISKALKAHAEAVAASGPLTFNAAASAPSS
eukprot:15998-Heterococcus_DN1.PRE.1